MTKQIVFLFSFLFICIISSYSQNRVIDSLNQLLHSNVNDTNKTIILARLSREYLYFKTDTALTLAKKGLMLAKEISFPKGESRCLNSMANAISQLGDNAKALELFLQSLKISEKIGDFQTMTMALGNIGIIYGSQGDYDRAIEYYFKSNAIATKLKNQNYIISNLINIGATYEKSNRLDSARFYTNLAYKIALKENNFEFLSGVLLNLGNIYSKLQQPAIALANYKQGLFYAGEANYNEGVCEAALGISKLFLKERKNDSCLLYAKLSLLTAQRHGFTQWILNSSDFLLGYYKQTKLVDSAYAYQSILIAAKDSLFDQEKNRQIQNLSFNEAMRQQELAIIKATQEKERSDNIQYALVGIGLITFVIIFILLTNNIIINEKWIEFLGVLGLLLLFEFLNLFLHPYISKITHHSPFFMLILMVILAAILIPQHHRIEKWIVHKMIEKNKILRHKITERNKNKLISANEEVENS